MLQDQQAAVRSLFPVEKLNEQGQIIIDLTVPYSELKLGEELGHGAYGIVYKGRLGEKDVAIKVLKKLPIKAQLKAFLREAEIMFLMGNESDHIVRLKKICLESPHYSLVMEFMAGGSLYRLLHNKRKLPWPIRFQIAVDVARGLETLHQHRIVHRDLTSFNILLNEEFRAKLSDFGFSDIESTRGLVGSARWMGPELFEPDAKSSPVSDIYSFGVVMWELASREIPFAGYSDDAVIISEIKKGKKETIPDNCPELLKILINGCWGMPNQRPLITQVLEQLKILLGSKLASKEVAAKPAELLDGASQPVPVADPIGGVAPLPSEELKKIQETYHKRFLELEQRIQLQINNYDQEIQYYQEVIENFRLREAQLLSDIGAKDEELKRQQVKSEDKIAGSGQQLENQISTLLELVVNGKQDEAETMIGINRQILYVSGQVIDQFGRLFETITAFQYALWAMDYHMWTMMRRYMPVEDQRIQFNALETKGTKYGTQYDLKPLTDAMQEYLDHAKEWKIEQCEEHWVQTVGGEQLTLPMHVINEYTRPDRPFNPCPKEWESKLPRSTKVEVFDFIHGNFTEGSWFVAPSDGNALGCTYAFYRAGAARCYSLIEAPFILGKKGGMEIDPDLKALRSLWATRTEQRKQLKSELLASAVSAAAKKSPMQHQELVLSGQNIFSLIPAPRPEIKVAADAVSSLLQLVIEGGQKQAEEMISRNGRLLLAPGDIKDLSGRTFVNFTAFQLALWMVDFPMWTMIRKYLPEEIQLLQYNALEAKEIIHGNQYDIKPLTDALQELVDNERKWEYDHCMDHWIKKVGGAQKMAPVHIVDAYANRFFSPCPEDWEKELLRTKETSIRFCRQSSSKRIEEAETSFWFKGYSDLESLGVSFAFARCYLSELRLIGISDKESKDFIIQCANGDLKALKSLWKARMARKESLKSELADKVSMLAL